MVIQLDQVEVEVVEIEIEAEVEEVAEGEEVTTAEMAAEVGEVIAMIVTGRCLEVANLTVGLIETLQQDEKAKEVIYAIIATNLDILPGIVLTNP